MAHLRPPTRTPMCRGAAIGALVALMIDAMTQRRMHANSLHVSPCGASPIISMLIYMDGGDGITPRMAPAQLVHDLLRDLGLGPCSDHPDDNPARGCGRHRINHGGITIIIYGAPLEGRQGATWGPKDPDLLD